ncbi:uncharacterized protein LOC126678278 [Mercurialis annua]|uniref:uncharacterized protein LOC126678278 n=1 Tax=Mercurialis annua TaxID=3986 RepID=UPI00215EBD07|nr:uncharacterized protein LOC126678278 [Mercurialis annua]
MDNYSFNWIVIYGSNSIGERQRLWSKLVDLSKSIRGPWFIQGDFNAVLCDEDRCCGTHLDYDHSYELSNCILAAGIKELRSVGCHFTWNNKQIGDNKIWRRLDRVFVNENVYDSNLRAHFDAIPAGISDHCPIVTIIQKDIRGNQRSLRFFNFCTTHSDFSSIIEEEWKNYRIVQKLKAISIRLSRINKAQFAKISNKVLIHRKRLNRIQIDIQKDPNNIYLMEEENVMARHFRYLLKCEQSFFKQKYRVQWLSLGDSNTKFFYNSIKARKMVNSIPLLKLDYGRIINSSEEIIKEMTSYFKLLFSKNDMGRSQISRNTISSGNVISNEDSTNPMKKVTMEEVKNVVFSIRSDKAAGPDGINGYFFKSYLEYYKR